MLWYAGRWWRDHLAISLVAQCEHDRIGAGHACGQTRRILIRVEALEAFSKSSRNVPQATILFSVPPERVARSTSVTSLPLTGPYGRETLSAVQRPLWKCGCCVRCLFPTRTHHWHLHFAGLGLIMLTPPAPHLHRSSLSIHTRPTKTTYPALSLPSTYKPIAKSPVVTSALPPRRSPFVSQPTR